MNNRVGSNLAGLLADPASVQSYLQKGFIHSIMNTISDTASTILRQPNPNYLFRRDLDRSLTNLKATVLANQNTHTSQIKKELDVIKQVFIHLCQNGNHPSEMYRMHDEINQLDVLLGSSTQYNSSYQAVTAHLENHLKNEVQILRDLIDTVAKKPGALNTPMALKWMLKLGLSKSAIAILTSPDFVPYKPVGAHIPFNQICRLSAHNACITNASDPHGNHWMISQQGLKLSELLVFGVRSLEIDIAMGPQGTKDEGRIMICHGYYYTNEPQKIGDYESFHSKLWEISQWLKNHKSETLIVNLDCLRDANITPEAINKELAAFSDLIYTPDDLARDRKPGRPLYPNLWPSAEQMGDKRLIVMYPEEAVRFKLNKAGIQIPPEQSTLPKMTFEEDCISVSINEKPNGTIGFKERKRETKNQQATIRLQEEGKVCMQLLYHIGFSAPELVSLYKVARDYLIKPLNRNLKTHLPDIGDQRLSRPDNHPEELIRKARNYTQQTGKQANSYHVDNADQCIKWGIFKHINEANQNITIRRTAKSRL